MERMDPSSHCLSDGGNKSICQNYHEIQRLEGECEEGSLDSPFNLYWNLSRSHGPKKDEEKNRGEREREI